ncbi:hypothetical protein [Microbacterium sp.]|uniref:hypothetical protein n=1 Tax=Microbacterium sp. TaxID=51671 RepID=UPI00281273A8|nr:hypothetical protein [Microbacterium sp.]
MTARASQRPWGPGFDTWQSLFAFAYRGLATGACLALFALPLAVVLIGVPRPAETAPFLILCALPLGPALSAAFWAFDAASDTGSSAPFALFARGLAATWWRGLGVWAITSALAVFLFVDAVAVAGTPFALLLGPLLGVIGVVVLAATPVALAAVGMPQRPGILAAAKAGLYAAVRRPLPSLMTLLILGAWVVIVLAQPVVGVLGLGGFALMLVWMNAAAQLTAVGARPDSPTA